MSTRRLLLCVAAVCLMLTTWGRQAIGAADCGESTPAPKFQVGDKWVWRDEKGGESTREVVGFEGDLAQVKWADPRATQDKEGMAFIDPYGVTRKAIRPNGEIVTKQAVGAYVTIGQKVMDYPLQVGKKWELSFLTQPRSGLGTLQSYTNRYSVLGCEEVLTPAGKFPALKIEIESSVQGGRYSGILHIWYASKAKASVRRQYVPSQWWGGGRFLDNELIKYEVK